MLVRSFVDNFTLFTEEMLNERTQVNIFRIFTQYDLWNKECFISPDDFDSEEMTRRLCIEVEGYNREIVLTLSRPYSKVRDNVMRRFRENNFGGWYK